MEKSVGLDRCMPAFRQLMNIQVEGQRCIPKA